jgi:hypothetical protein
MFRSKNTLLMERLPAEDERFFAKLLVDGGFISPQDLEAALERQGRTGDPLGETLVGMGRLDPLELKVLLAVNGNLASYDDTLQAAAGERVRIGELLLKAERITLDQLGLALGEQKQTGEKLGEVFVRHEWLTRNELDAVLAFQGRQGTASASERSRLGHILLSAGLITRGQLNDALARQKQSGKRIGELLIEAGYVQPRHIDWGLKFQAKITAASLIAVLAMAGVFDAREAVAAGTKETMTITARVLERTNLRVVSQVAELVITDADIRRGYVEIPAATQIAVRTNNPAGYLLQFESGAEIERLFRSVEVTAMGRNIQLAPQGGWVPMPYTRGEAALALGYRFTLSEKAAPGVYPWPLMVSTIAR